MNPGIPRLSIIVSILGTLLTGCVAVSDHHGDNQAADDQVRGVVLQHERRAAKFEVVATDTVPNQALFTPVFRSQLLRLL